MESTRYRCGDVDELSGSQPVPERSQCTNIPSNATSDGKNHILSNIWCSKTKTPRLTHNFHLNRSSPHTNCNNRYPFVWRNGPSGWKMPQRASTLLRFTTRTDYRKSCRYSHPAAPPSKRPTSGISQSSHPCSSRSTTCCRTGRTPSLRRGDRDHTPRVGRTALCAPT